MRNLLITAAVTAVLGMTGAHARAEEATAADAPTDYLQLLTEPIQQVIDRATSLLGVNYRRGGESPHTGLDCSGLVRFVFRDVLAIDLPRRAADIGRLGEVVRLAELRPGDLVFFNTLRSTFSHVGIYLGESRFLHAASSGGGVRIDSMSADYWKARFNGARRILASN